jgi:hypothetical protein
MSKSRQEIDLREQIATEIEALIKGHQPITGADEEQESIDALWRAIGVVREPILHGQACPCSQCQRFAIRTCKNTCGNLTNTFAQGELLRLHAAMGHQINTLYYCGYCHNGRNEWSITQMLFDLDNEMAVTPCCHTEATEALKCYCPEEACEADDDSLAKQERLDYVWSQS